MCPFSPTTLMAIFSLAWFLVGLLLGMRLRRSGSGSNSSNNNSGRNSGRSMSAPSGADRAPAGRGGDNGRPRTSDLYVGNLPDDTKEDDIQKAFSRFGTVADVRLISGRGDSGEAKCFAFVTMGSPDQAQAGIRGLDGKDFNGREIVVNEARSRRRRSGRR